MSEAKKKHPLRHLALRALGCALVFGLDRALAWLAVEGDAAGALLSPGGAVPLTAFAIAGAFFAIRLTLSIAVCVTVALAASQLVGWIWDSLPRSGAPSRVGARPEGEIS
jgi:hypothetical protein